MRCSTWHRLLLVCITAAGCAPKNADWQDIDYSSVYRRAGGGNDSGYSAPSGIGCLDDDLQGCQ